MAQRIRPEIQGLRAIAVLIVLVFHIWPSAVPGGYIGVDVFFVISGYLITGLLLREVESSGRISVVDFYGRRIRRLLPAATVVLVAAAICLQFVPSVRWGDTGEQIAASALYYQNWWLAVQSVDYLAADNAPGPLQHFWSLSIEEQYYILWPIAFGLLAWFAKKSQLTARSTFVVMVSLVFLASLAYSVYLTPRNTGWAYFATTSRAWELAFGGLLAVAPIMRRGGLSGGIGLTLSAAGLGLIVFSALVYSKQTMFPGYAALVPTAGAALVLLGTFGIEANRIARLLSIKPMQYFGDISYSLYLWHWPVAVYTTNVLGVEALNSVEGSVVLAISIALAHFSKTMIEDRWRKPFGNRKQHLRIYALGAICIGISLLSTGWTFHKVKQSHVMASVAARSSAPASSSGATLVAFKPAIADAENDAGTAYRQRCITTSLGTDIQYCMLANSPNGPVVVVVGDSHAASWLPAFERLAVERKWTLVAVIKSACTFSRFPDEIAAAITRDTMKSCVEWQKKAVRAVKELRPDLLVTAHSISSMGRVVTSRSNEVVAAATVAAWKMLEHDGLTVVAMVDTPRFGSKVPECLSMNQANLGRCGRERSAALPARDPLVQAVATYPQAKLVDLSDEICGPVRCEPVVNGMIAWRDAHHMTRTFAQSLAPALGKKLDAVTGGRFRQVKMNSNPKAPVAYADVGGCE